MSKTRKVPNLPQAPDHEWWAAVGAPMTPAEYEAEMEWRADALAEARAEAAAERAAEARAERYERNF